MTKFDQIYDDPGGNYPPAEPPGHDPQAEPPKSDRNQEEGEDKEIGGAYEN